MDYSLDFLKKLDKMKIRVQYAKIILLSFDEQPIQEIQGTISSGNISVNGSAAVRRTLNLTMLTGEEDLENINNIISINKKIKVLVGYNNPFDEYDDIVWFKCGTFIINKASSSRSTSGWNISITGQDKMCRLNGFAGGTLPASVTFSEYYEEDPSDPDIILIKYPTIFQIIQEAVAHYGGEHVNNIIINDVPDTAKLLLKWIGDTILWVENNGNQITTSQPANTVIANYSSYNYNDDVCYKETDFTYPGELTLNAGDTVVTLLDKIVSTLGNFEYFYDIDGKFIFQQKKNYQDIQSPLLDLDNKDYLKNYNNESTIWSFDTLQTVTSVTKNPNYENIKNDFIVWGTRTTAAGAEIGIRYHLAIDEKPNLDKALQYMYQVVDGDSVWYEFSYDELTELKANETLIGKPCNEWREELYRGALEASVSTGYFSDYDAELLAEWRKLFNPCPTDEEASSYDPETFWLLDVTEDPRSLDYWLDFIDTAALNSYSVSKIGRRSKVVVDKEIASIANQDVLDLIIIDEQDYLSADGTVNGTAIENLTEYYNSYGQKYCILGAKAESAVRNNLVTSSTGASAFDKIRDLLYQHLTYNTSLSIQCLPIYWLEPNNLIYIYDEKSHINDNYAITQFTLPLGYNGTMSITAVETLRRL